MSYVLFLGFKCTVYKKPPSVRVSLNDIFLDEFSVVPNKPCDFNNFNFFNDTLSKCLHKGRSIPSNTLLSRKEQLPKDEDDWINKDIIFKVIEFDKISLAQTNKIKIEILNTDNNYTNGFMTQSTMLSLYLVQLLPKICLINPFDFYKNFVNDRIKLKKMHIDVYSMKKFYQNKIAMYDIFDYNYVKSKLSQGLINYTAKVPYHNTYTNKIENLNYGEWFGSSGFFTFQMPKYLLEPDIPVEIADIDDLILYCLANKYKQYANQ